MQLDATFHSRVNILLVAESVFLAAVSQVWATKDLIVAFMCVVALATTYLLWKPLAALSARTASLARRLNRDGLPVLFMITWAVILVWSVLGFRRESSWI